MPLQFHRQYMRGVSFYLCLVTRWCVSENMTLLSPWLSDLPYIAAFVFNVSGRKLFSVCSFLASCERAIAESSPRITVSLAVLFLLRYLKLTQFFSSKVKNILRLLFDTIGAIFLMEVVQCRVWLPIERAVIARSVEPLSRLVEHTTDHARNSLCRRNMCLVGFCPAAECGVHIANALLSTLLGLILLMLILIGCYIFQSDAPEHQYHCTHSLQQPCTIACYPIPPAQTTRTTGPTTRSRSARNSLCKMRPPARRSSSRKRSTSKWPLAGSVPSTTTTGVNSVTSTPAAVAQCVASTSHAALCTEGRVTTTPFLRRSERKSSRTSQRQGRKC